MSLPAFLEALREHGRPKVGPPKAVSPGELADALTVLRAMEEDARREAPPGAPAFLESVALWAAGVVYGASQALVYRELDADAVKALVGVEAPKVSDATAAAWSADVTLHVLPDLVGLARGASESDPLCEALTKHCHAWPLSSVGVRGLEGVAPGAVADNEALLQIYVDRIFEKRDLPRLGDGRVREAARAALGAHPELCPEAAKAVEVTA